MRDMESESLQGIVQGHELLFVCALLYLFWWIIFFRPGANVHGALYAAGVVCIIGAVIAGIVGVVRMLVSAVGLPESSSVPGFAFIVGAIIGYVALAFATNRLFGRPITTELLLICIWCALELYVLSVVMCANALPSLACIALVVVVLALTAGCLVCYVLYYNLPSFASFVDGMAPLIAVGVDALVTVAILKVLGV